MTAYQQGLFNIDRTLGMQLIELPFKHHKNSHSFLFYFDRDYIEEQYSVSELVNDLVGPNSRQLLPNHVNKLVFWYFVPLQDNLDIFTRTLVVVLSARVLMEILTNCICNNSYSCISVLFVKLVDDLPKRRVGASDGIPSGLELYILWRVVLRTCCGMNQHQIPDFSPGTLVLPFPQYII